MTGKVAHRGREKGMALVMVLGVLAVTLLMVVHVMTVSEVIAREAYMTCKRSELRYLAESAADHALWMHITDRRLFPDRALGENEDDRLQETDFEPWMADRREHRLYNSNVYAYISDVERTVRLDDEESFRTDVDLEDTETTELVDDFLDVLADYKDSDTTVRLNGMEEGEYAEMGFYAMPRDGAIQFREEIFWLPGWRNVIDGEITIVPPEKKSLGEESGKISFFSASPNVLQNKLDCTDDELESILEARRLWTEESVPLDESLSADLLYNIKSMFDFMESHIAQIFASAATDDGEVRVIYSVIREVDLNKNTIFADRENEALSIWNRMIQ